MSKKKKQFKLGQIVVLKEDGQLNPWSKHYKKGTFATVIESTKNIPYTVEIRHSEGYVRIYLVYRDLFRPLNPGNERYNGKKLYESQKIE